MLLFFDERHIMAQNHDTNVFYGAWEKTSRKKKKAIRIFLSIFIFTGLSLGLCFLRFNVPFAPDFLSGDFSVLPELIAAIAYGPIIGSVVCLLKFALHIVILPTAAITDVSNCLTELAFLLTASVFYYKKQFHKKERNKQGKKRQYRRKRIIIGSLLGIIPALIIQFVTNYYFVFPMLEKYYGQYGYMQADILQKYATSFAAISENLPKITKLWQGIIAFNLPMTLVKLLIVTIAVALIYPIISPYLHFRKKTK